MYVYLKDKYPKPLVKYVFKCLGLSKQHNMPIRGLRGTGNSTLTAVEAYLGGYSVVATTVNPSSECCDEDYYKTHIVLNSKYEVTAINKLLKQLKGN